MSREKTLKKENTMKNVQMLVKTSCVAVSLLLLSPALASAQTTGFNQPSFESFDLDHDNHLTENEMNTAIEKRMKERMEHGRGLRNAGSHSEFSRIDADNDGTVTKKEFDDHQTRRRAR